MWCDKSFVMPQLNGPNALPFSGGRRRRPSAATACWAASSLQSRQQIQHNRWLGKCFQLCKQLIVRVPKTKSNVTLPIRAGQHLDGGHDELQPGPGGAIPRPYGTADDLSHNPEHLPRSEIEGFLDAKLGSCVCHVVCPTLNGWIRVICGR